MKVKKIIIITILTLVIIFITLVTIAFQKYEKASYEPVYFEVVASELIFKDKLGSPWDRVTESEKRPIEWIINKNEFEKLDSVYLGFKNISKEKMYYMTWGKPLSRIRESFIIYKNNSVDTIKFRGFGCGTGIYLTPLKNKESTSSKFLNPLMYKYSNGYDLNLEDENFPKNFKEIYGDSVAIKFEQATFGLPWGKYPSQMIESNQVVISTDKVLENWRKGLYLKLPEREKTMEEHFGLKKMKPH